MSGPAQMLLGAGAALGVINAALPNGAGTPSPQYTIANTGAAIIAGQGALSWVLPATAAIAALYQVKFDLQSGALSGTLATWLDCSSNQGVQNTTPNSTATFTISFREKATGAVRSVQAGKTLQYV